MTVALQILLIVCALTALFSLPSRQRSERVHVRHARRLERRR